MKLHFLDILGIMIIILAMAIIGMICFFIGIVQLLIYSYRIKNKKYDINKRSIMIIKVSQLKEALIFGISMFSFYIFLIILILGLHHMRKLN